MHSDMIGRDRAMFGEDAGEFNPLRWLARPGETDTEYRERVRAMNTHDLAFGHGPRGWIRKHVAEMEIYKFVPTFFALMQVRPTLSRLLLWPDSTADHTSLGSRDPSSRGLCDSCLSSSSPQKI